MGSSASVNLEPAGAGMAVIARSIVLVLAVLLVATGLFIQYNTFLNHDVAWFLYSARDVLNGAEFGQDIVSPNPPLIWYLSMPPVILADAFGIDVDGVFRIYAAVVSLGSLSFAYWFMRTRGLCYGPYAGSLFFVVAVYCLFVGSYRDFGQREYLALVLSLPYVLSAAARIKAMPLRPLVAILIGAAAALGFALKPQLLVVPVLVELVVVVRTRSLRRSFCRGKLGNGGRRGPALLCFLSLLTVTPGYLFDVVPMLLDAHWGYDADPIRLL